MSCTALYRDCFGLLHQAQRNPETRRDQPDRFWGQKHGSPSGAGPPHTQPPAPAAEALEKAILAGRAGLELQVLCDREALAKGLRPTGSQGGSLAHSPIINLLPRLPVCSKSSLSRFILYVTAVYILIYLKPETLRLRCSSNVT